MQISSEKKMKAGLKKLQKAEFERKANTRKFNAGDIFF